MIDNEERYGQEERREERRQGLLIPIGWLLRWLWTRFKFLPAVLVIASSAHAIESICPGGASPRGDIQKCMDAETACASPSSDLCFTDNGFSSRDDHRGTDMQVVTDASLAVLGSRLFVNEGILGGTGTGYATYTLSAPSNELRIRWYQRFHQYAHYYFNHFLGVTINGTGCTRGATLEMGGGSGPYLYTSGNCGVVPGDNSFQPNQGAGTVPQFKNGKWYLMEVAIKMDTACGTPASATGCNGEYKLWVDGALVISHTNINWGGNLDSAQIIDVQPVRNYRHKRNPYVPGKVYFDQIVIGTSSSTAIGAATGATNIGTAVTDIYSIECGIEPFYIADYFGNARSYSPELDFNGAGGNAITTCGTAGSNWRTVAGTGDATIYHTGVVTDQGTGVVDTASRPIAEQSFKTACTGANCGAGWFAPRTSGPATGSEGDGNTNAYRNGTPPQWAMHGYIYLPSTSVPNDLITYAGFAGDGMTAHSNFVGISESSGKWAIMQRVADGTPAIVSTSSKTITRDTWHRFEIIVWDSEGVSLMIDGERVFNQLALSSSPTWLFDAAHNADHSGAVIGIIDYRGTGTVTAYYDDLSIGSTSFWSSDGWGSDSPFSSAVTSLKNWLRLRLRHWRTRN